MYSQIKRLRLGGARRPLADIGADNGVVGELRAHYDAGVTYVRVVEWGASQGDPLIPILINPQIISVGNDRMLLRGLERVGDPHNDALPTVVQEWTVMWLGHPGA
jgi:hypothetical protein